MAEVFAVELARLPQQQPWWGCSPSLQAHPAQFLPLDDGGILQAKLAGADGGADVAAGSGADDDQVEVHGAPLLQTSIVGIFDRRLENLQKLRPRQSVETTRWSQVMVTLITVATAT